MRAIVFVILGLIACLYAVSCGSSSSSDDSNACATAPSYADITETVTESCALSGCHVAGSDRSDLRTEAAMKTYAANSATRIRANDMPRAPGVLSDETKKANLLTWLDCNGS